MWQHKTIMMKHLILKLIRMLLLNIMSNSHLSTIHILDLSNHLSFMDYLIQLLDKLFDYYLKLDIEKSIP